jgi:hypothetical protein
MDGRFFAPEALTPVPTGRDRRAALARMSSSGAVDEDLAEDVGMNPLHDPPLAPHDEAVFLLTAAAEIEHALMVQYLFAAYSVRTPHSAAGELQVVQNLLTEIAREEMGHLATVQNLLHLIGGPLNLNRDQAPYGSDVYPFRFTLEPLTLSSLAKYVTAESPATLPAEVPADDVSLIGQIADDAEAANDGVRVRHVGPIYRRIARLLAAELDDGDFRLTTASRQARNEDWGFQPRFATEGEELIVDDFPGTTAPEVRDAAVAAVRRISEQGEGFDLPPAGVEGESHFERFLDIYKRVAALVEAGTTLTWPVATNPNTTTSSDAHTAGPPELAALREAHLAGGRITEPRTRAWAQLFNARYRLLLGQFQHFMRLDQDLYSAASGPGLGDRTPHGLLLRNTFDEMRHLSKIAVKLVQMRRDPATALHAGPPFELPYTLDLPDGEPQRWRMHLDATRAATQVATGLLADGPDPFLEDLVEQDAATRTLIEPLADGGPIPAGSLPQGFAKAVTILEEAVRGFTVGSPHGGFWNGVTRDQFLDTTPAGGHPIARMPDNAVDPNPDHSPLVNRIEGTTAARMPLLRPAIPTSRIAYIRNWIAGGASDDAPAGQVGVRHERPPAAEAPGPAGPVPPVGGPSFAADIRPLFRETPDRASMLFAFDLHDHGQVRDNAAAILSRLLDGTMPCDLPWPPERIALFQRWMDAGSPP